MAGMALDANLARLSSAFVCKLRTQKLLALVRPSWTASKGDVRLMIFTTAWMMLTDNTAVPKTIHKTAGIFDFQLR